MVSYASLCLYWKWPTSIRRCQFLSVLAAGFLLHLSLGWFYTFGNLVPYLVSYARHYSCPAGLRNTDAPFVFASQAAGLALGMVTGGVLEKRMGPRMLSFVGGSIMCSGVAASYFAIKYSFWMLLLTYGFVYGLGMGMAYIAPIACSMRWLPKWKGVASGVVVSGYGISALLFTVVETSYINPRNYSPNIAQSGKEMYFSQVDLLERVPYIFLVLAGSSFAMQIISCPFLVNPSPPEEQQDYETLPDNDLNTGEDNNPENPVNLNYDYESRGSSQDLEDSTKFIDTDQSTYINGPRQSRAVSLTSSFHSELERSSNSWTTNVIYNVTPLRMLTKLNFYLLWLMFLSAGTAVAFISTLYKSFGQTFIQDDHFLMGAGAASAIFNLLGRLAWGALADLSTYKFAITVQSAVMCCLMATFYCTSYSGKALFFVWLCGIFFCIGGYYSLFPTAISREFGQEYMSINYAILSTSHIVGAIVGAVLSSFLSRVFMSEVQWEELFYIVIGMLLLKYVIALCYRHKRYMRLKHPKDLLESASKQQPSSIRFPINK